MFTEFVKPDGKIEGLPPPGNSNVHVWRASLDQDPEVADSLRRVLAPDELERARHFRFNRHRNLFIIRRGLLRSLLAMYLRMQPDKVRLQAGEHGKLFLHPTIEQCAIRFNLSHSNGVALFAFTSGHEVGVDIEYIREDMSFTDIAIRFFSANEVADLFALPENDRIVGFFNCWTRKEAFLKGLGSGLSVELSEFDVSLAPGAPPRILRSSIGPVDFSSWSLYELQPGEGFVGALAVSGTGHTIECFNA